MAADDAFKACLKKLHIASVWHGKPARCYARLDEEDVGGVFSFISDEGAGKEA